MSGATLTIPPLAEHVRVARVVAVAAARRIGLSSEQLDDVRLAVGEAVSRAVSRHIAGNLVQDISIDIIEVGSEFTVVVTDHAGVGLPETDDGVALALIRALAPRLQLDGSVLTLSWATAA
ncbi:MAG: ATP-binding protein [Actinomycetes bacterium]